MSLLNIPKTPPAKKPSCIVCTWVEGLPANEQTYFAQLTHNYTASELYRELKPLAVPFAEPTLRKHVASDH